MPTYFISHGGGPWPFMKDQMPHLHEHLEQSLIQIAKELPSKPKAIVMVSAHWEASEFLITANPQPPMVYDYYGFPESTYKVRYSAPGQPELAAKIQKMLSAAELKASIDTERGFDHGAFVPAAIMFPSADIPMVQVSLLKGYDPLTHIKAGRILAPLRDEGVLLIGSGLSYHNLREFNERGAEASRAFDKWLQDSLVGEKGESRTSLLLRWPSAPSARRAHPREDHLIPLMVVVGAAEEASGHCIYHEDHFFGGLSVSSFRFGEI